MKNQSTKADIIAVAKAANVSPSTVSRSYNHPDLVKPATRKKIEQAIQDLGYVRNRAAQTMHGKRSATIGLVVPTVNNAIFSEVIQSFSEAVDEAGFTILIATHGFDLGREYALTRKFLEHRVDGIALTGLDHLDATYNLIEQQEVPALQIWSYAHDARLPCIGADNVKAGRLAAEHLVALGHRRIGLVFPPVEGNDRARARLEGAEATLTAHGIDVPAHWRKQAPYSVALAKSACEEVFRGGDVPTAILCGNDVIAQGAIYAGVKYGFRVPDDISIIGIGDFPGFSEMEPALTTVRIPAVRIGKLAGSGLTSAITQSRPSRLGRLRLPVSLVTRGTTLPAKG
ncbi:LacI family DNA-binding transcriptional regulator [Rhodobacteraceae bacterium NNCM2]|nr:LacI family DNA-binding transcriptional regulator [Coraliihabitans acroporae]